MIERTKMRFAKVNGKEVPLMWDNASSLDFGREMGYETVNDIQRNLMTAIGELQPNEAGEVKVQSVETLVLMAYTAIITAAEIKEQKPSVSKRELKNAILSDDGPGIIEALVECLVQFSPVGKEEDEALGKLEAVKM